MVGKRINLYITKEQEQFIKSQNLSFSEFIRRFLDDYIQKIKNQYVSASVSEVKGGN